MNLLFFTHSSDLAGSERSLLELVKELISDYGAICMVILPCHGPLEGLLHEVGCSTIIAPLNWWCAGKLPHSNEKIQERLGQSYEWIVNNLTELRNYEPDIILTNSLVIPWGAVAAYLLKRPHVWMINEYGKLDFGFEFYLPFQQVLKIIEESSNKIVTRSKSIQKELFPNQKSNQVKTIYRYIDISEKNTQSQGSIDSYYHIPGAYRLFLPGRLIEAKGQEDAVRAVFDLINTHKCSVELVLAGYTTSDYQSYIEGIIQNEGVNSYIHIIPFLEDIIPIFNSVDIILVCSRMEAFGRVILEAMLMNKVVVATNTGGTTEMIVDRENGLLFSPGDHEKLANQIAELINHPTLYSYLSQNAYRFAKLNFTKEKFGGEFNKMLLEIKNMKFPQSKYRNEFGDFLRYIEAL
jgi:glycosyltransferase involved in cell wall biosynthesis